MEYTDSFDSESDCDRKKYKCNFGGCKAKFLKNRKLINHIRRHKGERPFVCDEPECTKSYTNSSHLLRHKKTSHANEKKLVKCTHNGCGKLFANTTNLKKHLQRKHTKVQFPCTECSLEFPKKWRLQEHLCDHTKEPTFKCDKCSQTFKKYRHYRRHKSIHVSLTCSCGEPFDRWTKLLKHRKTCIKELSCSICLKVFSNKTNLKIHLLTHDDERKAKYHCGHENCTRNYEYKKNLMYHIRSVHFKNKNVQNIPCSHDGCSKKFKSELYLRRHLIAFHQKPKQRKTKRNPRSDKGKPTKSMAGMLSGIDLTIKEHKAIIQGKIVSKPIPSFKKPPKECSNSDSQINMQHDDASKANTAKKIKIIDDGKTNESSTSSMPNCSNEVHTEENPELMKISEASVEIPITVSQSRSSIELDKDLQDDETLLRYCDEIVEVLEPQVRPQSTMAGMLCGIDLTIKEHKAIIGGEIVNNHIPSFKEPPEECSHSDSQINMQHDDASKDNTDKKKKIIDDGKTNESSTSSVPNCSNEAHTEENPELMKISEASVTIPITVSQSRSSIELDKDLQDDETLLRYCDEIVEVLEPQAQPQNTMAGMLCGIDLSIKEHKAIIQGEIVSKPIPSFKKPPKQCSNSDSQINMQHDDSSKDNTAKKNKIIDDGKTNESSTSSVPNCSNEVHTEGNPELMKISEVQVVIPITVSQSRSSIELDKDLQNDETLLRYCDEIVQVLEPQVQPQSTVAGMLCGIDLTIKERKAIIRSEIVNDPIPQYKEPPKNGGMEHDSSKDNTAKKNKIIDDCKTNESSTSSMPNCSNEVHTEENPELMKISEAPVVIPITVSQSRSSIQLDKDLQNDETLIRYCDENVEVLEPQVQPQSTMTGMFSGIDLTIKEHKAIIQSEIVINPIPSYKEPPENGGMEHDSSKDNTAKKKKIIDDGKPTSSVPNCSNEAHTEENPELMNISEALVVIPITVSQSRSRIQLDKDLQNGETLLRYCDEIVEVLEPQVQPQSTMAGMLSGIDLTIKEHKTVIRSEIVNNPIPSYKEPPENGGMEHDSSKANTAKKNKIIDDGKTNESSTSSVPNCSNEAHTEENAELMEIAEASVANPITVSQSRSSIELDKDLQNDETLLRYCDEMLEVMESQVLPQSTMAGMSSGIDLTIKEHKAINRGEIVNTLFHHLKNLQRSVVVQKGKLINMQQNSTKDNTAKKNKIIDDCKTNESSTSNNCFSESK